MNNIARKILACGILIATLAGRGEAQDRGLLVGGRLLTGLRAEVFGGDWADGEDNVAFVSVWHDDAGNRFDLNLTWTEENFGFVFGSEWRFSTSATIASIPNAFGWFTLADGFARVTFGRIDRGLWHAPGPEGFSYSTGTGARIEITPVRGLNAGVLFRAPSGGATADTGFPVPGQGNYGASARAVDFLGNTSFGFSYAKDRFRVASGLELRTARGRRYRSLDLGGVRSPFSTGAMFNNPLSVDNAGGHNNVGISTYIGARLNIVDNLFAEASGQFANIDNFGDFGWIWTTQRVRYTPGSFVLGLDMHQNFFLGTGTDFVEASDTGLFLQFSPMVVYRLNSRVDLGLDIPFRFLTGITWQHAAAGDGSFDIRVVPRITFRHGPGFTINAQYFFGLVIFDRSAESNGLYIRNAIQINFSWSI